MPLLSGFISHLRLAIANILRKKDPPMRILSMVPVLSAAPMRFICPEVDAKLQYWHGDIGWKSYVKRAFCTGMVKLFKKQKSGSWNSSHRMTSTIISF